MKQHSLLILLVFTVINLLFISCGGNKSDKPSGEKLKVVCTIGMIADIVKEIGGDAVEVKGLMGPGVDPHLYKATPSDVEALGNSDIIFYNGLHLESKMGELFEKMSNMKTTVAVSEVIPEAELMSPEGYSGIFDPHVWFDVQLWKYSVREVARTLIEKLPGKKDIIESNMESYLKKLDSLDSFIKNRISEVPPEQRVLITAHDAFGYFGKKYGFDVVGLQGISTESEAGTSDVQKLVNLIVDRKIRAIFVESSVPEKNIKAVQEAVKAKGWSVKIGGELYSDAMGDEGTFEGTYIGMTTSNVNKIVDALSGKGNGE